MANNAVARLEATGKTRRWFPMLTKGQEYTDQGQGYDEERWRERVLRSLSQRTAKLGLKMVPIAQPS